MAVTCGIQCMTCDYPISYHSALQQFGKEMTRDMQSSRIQQEAGKDMKSRLAEVCRKAKKK